MVGDFDFKKETSKTNRVFVGVGDIVFELVHRPRVRTLG